MKNVKERGIKQTKLRPLALPRFKADHDTLTSLGISPVTPTPQRRHEIIRANSVAPVEDEMDSNLLWVDRFEPHDAVSDPETRAVNSPDRSEGSTCCA